MTANRMKPVLAALLLAGLASAAQAEGISSRTYTRGDHHHHRGDEARSVRIDIRRDFGGRSIVAPRRAGNFYGGSIEAYSVRGHGIYFLRDERWADPALKTAGLAPKAKIIDVDKVMDGNVFASSACAFEAGVCIIRGGN
jgi:hypothetical protein